MKIGQLSKIHGLSCRQIRHYELMGLIECSREASSNYRVYRNETGQRLEMIKLLKSLGFSLDEIKLLFDAPQDEAAQNMFIEKCGKLEDLSRQINNQIQILLSVNRIISEKGMENLNIMEIIKDCVYIHHSNERMVSMEEKILLTFGEGIIPLCSGEDSLLDRLKEARFRLEKESGTPLPLIRIRDELSLQKLEIVIQTEGIEVYRNIYGEYDKENLLADIMPRLIDEWTNRHNNI